MNRKWRIIALDVILVGFAFYLFYVDTSQSNFAGFVLLIMAACATILVLMNKQEQENLQNIHSKVETAISEIDNFKPTNQIRTENAFLSIDENTSKVAIAGIDFNNDVKTYVYNFSDIIESEIIQDEVTLTKTSRASQVGGALVGGALAGGVGAVIGGLSGSTQSKAFVKRMSLKIVFDNLKDPFQTIDFFLSDKPVSANDQKFANAMYDINQWHSIMSIIINRNNKSVDVRAN